MHAVIEDRRIVFAVVIPPGFAGEYQEDVSFDEGRVALADWYPGQGCPRNLLCVSLSDPKHYRVFRDARKPAESGFRMTDKDYRIDLEYGS